MVLRDEFEGNGVSSCNSFQELGLKDVCVPLSNSYVVLGGRDNGSENRGRGNECGEETHGDFLKWVDFKR